MFHWLWACFFAIMRTARGTLSSSGRSPRATCGCGSRNPFACPRGRSLSWSEGDVGVAQMQNASEGDVGVVQMQNASRSWGCGRRSPSTKGPYSETIARSSDLGRGKVGLQQLHTAVHNSLSTVSGNSIPSNALSVIALIAVSVRSRGCRHCSACAPSM